ncbi:MAG: GTPase [Deltaproteobacteria bacterium]|nr:GTPase [Deltaproteobacteria bacterium]
MTVKRVLIMGAAGRDFHNFNVYFRDNPDSLVVGFTATQIPNIEGRCYPPALAGSRYPQGIPIYPETELAPLIRQHRVDTVVFSYSDVSYEYVMQRGAVAMRDGADYLLLAPHHTWLSLSCPVVAVTAVRTGCGKSQTSRKVARILHDAGKRVVAVRHPMPYGNLATQVCQRFATFEDLETHHCTIEEREEYEPYLECGLVVYAGIDYAQIARAVEREADVVIWDGGNNDAPFFRPDCHMTVLDPLRVGHERQYYPGEINFLMSDVLVINKYHQASEEQLAQLEATIRQYNPRATVVRAASKILLADPQAVQGKRVLAIEDGPTVTHGGMGYGAAYVAAREYGAGDIVDPRHAAVGSIRTAFEQYDHLKKVLPALGYYPDQLRELEETINATPCDLVLSASPIDLRRLIHVNKPLMRVTYELDELGTPDLASLLQRFLD